ncbi:MAG: hypothetical protein ACRDSE_06860 [Pseudonocardiaceae bacterium]
MIDGERREVRVDDSAVPLTRTEFDLLTALVGRPGRAGRQPDSAAVRGHACAVDNK